VHFVGSFYVYTLLYSLIISIYLSVASERQFDFICRCSGLQRKKLMLVEKTDCGG
jgi:hypothetical protein